ncbi:MAG: stage II sporulation protein R [Bacillota bacterium]
MTAEDSAGPGPATDNSMNQTVTRLPKPLRRLSWPSRREAGRVAAVLTVVAILLVSAQSAWAGRHQVAYNQANLTRQGIFRLHVRANSDEPADQAQKLKVRDAILTTFGPELAKLGKAKAAEAYARDHLARITTVAEQAAAENGEAYGVRATVGVGFFPTRVYGSLVVPSGFYHALQVAIGDGAGQNWWCVLFPPLCLTDLASEPGGAPALAAGGSLPDQALADGLGPVTLNPDELALLADPDQDPDRVPVELRWKLLDWARAAGINAKALMNRLVRVFEAAAGRDDGAGR